MWVNKMNDIYDETFHTVIRSDGTKDIKARTLVKEHSLTVNINGSLKFSLICSDQLLKELVVGRLLTTGLINGLEDISEISFDDTNSNVNVHITGYPDGRLVKRDLEKVSKPDWSYEDIFCLAREFSEGMPVHSKTQGTHSCILSMKQEVLFKCEDIGRHNTVDKAVGYALMNSISLSECILYISGRVPVDMMEKVIYSRIPVIVSKAVPTIDSVRLAKEYGVTLIVKAYPDQIEVC
ncbi:FdhD protein [Lachnospiraceae bacterium NE2001]|nr:FdhD protein [Lachnospiraceae bacterium NE2001]